MIRSRPIRCVPPMKTYKIKKNSVRAVRNCPECLVSDLTMLYSLISGHHSYSLSPHLTLIPTSNLSGHNLKINQPILNDIHSKQNVISRTAYQWNTLPDHVLQAESSSAFYSLVSKHIKDPFAYQPIH